MEPLPAAGNVRAGVMNFSGPFGPSAFETSEFKVEGTVGEHADVDAHFQGDAVFGRDENGESELSVTGLGSLLRRVSGISRREIDVLIGQLQTLRDKLETSSQRLQNDLSEYASLSQHVMELTKVVSESVRKLPDAHKGSA
jgi:hypothetical protein